MSTPMEPQHVHVYADPGAPEVHVHVHHSPADEAPEEAHETPAREAAETEPA